MSLLKAEGHHQCAVLSAELPGEGAIEGRAAGRRHCEMLK